MSKVELWSMMASLPGSYATHARQAEEEGWDGIGVPDTQSNLGDVYATLAVAASVTSRLKLATNVTNPFTRHPAVTASAIATIHGESGGRAVLGIGRGDSALAHIGLAPVPVAHLVDYVDRVQGYLRGEPVAFQPDPAGVVRSVEALQLGNSPAASQLRWLGGLGMAKVPVDAAANGPKVIAAMAPRVEMMTFANGASAERIGWAIDTALAARASAGLGAEGITFGIRVPVLVAASRADAVDRLRPRVASYARFSVLHGSVSGPIEQGVRSSLEAVRASYDMDDHHGDHVAAVVTDELVDAFAIAGPPSYCVERIEALVDVGVTRFVVGHIGVGTDAEATAASQRAFLEEVLPRLK